MIAHRSFTLSLWAGSLLFAVMLLCSSIAKASNIERAEHLVARKRPSIVGEESDEVPATYSSQTGRTPQSNLPRKQTWQTRKAHKNKTTHTHGKHQSAAAKSSHKKGYASSSAGGGGQDFHGKGTFFKPNHGACGNYNNENDYIVALSEDIYDKGKYCERDVHICHNNKCVDAKVTDLCPGCDHTSLDMSPVVFNALAKPEEGVIDIQWSFQ